MCIILFFFLFSCLCSAYGLVSVCSIPFSSFATRQCLLTVQPVSVFRPSAEHKQKNKYLRLFWRQADCVFLFFFPPPAPALCRLPAAFPPVRLALPLPGVAGRSALRRLCGAGACLALPSPAVGGRSALRRLALCGGLFIPAQKGRAAGKAIALASGTASVSLLLLAPSARQQVHISS